jgi:hypothetical protein
LTAALPDPDSSRTACRRRATSGLPKAAWAASWDQDGLDLAVLLLGQGLVEEGQQGRTLAHVGQQGAGLR